MIRTKNITITWRFFQMNLRRCECLTIILMTRYRWRSIRRRPTLWTMTWRQGSPGIFRCEAVIIIFIIPWIINKGNQYENCIMNVNVEAAVNVHTIWQNRFWWMLIRVFPSQLRFIVWMNEVLIWGWHSLRILLMCSSCSAAAFNLERCSIRGGTQFGSSA